MVVKGYLELLVLSELQKEEMSGLDVIRKLQDKLYKAPSTGSIYPLLDKLKENGYIVTRTEGRKKILCLTIKGKKYLETLMKEKEEQILKHFELVSECYGFQKKSKKVDEFISRLRKNSNIKDFMLWIELKEVLLSLAVKQISNDDKKAAKKIIRSTIKQLKDIRDR